MSLFTEVQNFDRFNQADGKCSFCGHHPRKAPDGTRDRTFRTNLHVHMEGPVEVCEHCLKDAAAVLGWVNPVEYERVQAEAADHWADLQEALDTIQDKENAIRSLAGELARSAQDAVAEKAASDA